MKPAASPKTKAFTLIELLLIIAVIAILLALLVPAGPRRTPAYTARCLSNQKQIALGLSMWKSDHSEHFPWQLSVTNEGTAEYIPRGETAPHFRILSNYLKYPYIFHCLADRQRLNPAATPAFPDSSNLSYFVATDSGTTPSLSILTGDRNLATNDSPITPGLFIYSTSMTVNWTVNLHRNSHQKPMGNLSFADGHAWTYKGSDLNPVFQHEGLAANHLAVP